MADVIRVTDEDMRADLEAKLSALNFAAKRVTPVVGSKDYPTPWDYAHGRIDATLDDWEATPAGKEG